MMGYKASLKACQAGLAMVVDVSVSVFLKGGNLLELVASSLNMRDVPDLANVSVKHYNERERPKSSSGAEEKNYGLPNDLMSKLSEAFKGTKIRLLHLKHFKKINGFGELIYLHSKSFIRIQQIFDTSVFDMSNIYLLVSNNRTSCE